MQCAKMMSTKFNHLVGNRLAAHRVMRSYSKLASLAKLNGYIHLNAIAIAVVMKSLLGGGGCGGGLLSLEHPLIGCTMAHWYIYLLEKLEKENNCLEVNTVICACQVANKVEITTQMLTSRVVVYTCTISFSLISFCAKGVYTQNYKYISLLHTQLPAVLE